MIAIMTIKNKLFLLSFAATVFGSVALFGEETQERDSGPLTPAQFIRRENEHPLMPILRWTEKERPQIAEIKDYTAKLTKQENIDGVLHEPQVMEIKVRHEPFSVYIKTRYPAKLNGQEAIFVRGRNDNKIIAHGTGAERTVGTQRLVPDGFIAMRGQKYPITEMGLLNLVDKLLEVGRKDSKFGECEVKYVENVKVGERTCLMLEITHPTPRSNFIFHRARIFVDTEMELPIRYDSHDWPTDDGKKLPLIEEYTYENIKINVGLTDRDFDPQNPAYSFTRGE